MQDAKTRIQSGLLLPSHLLARRIIVLLYVPYLYNVLYYCTPTSHVCPTVLVLAQGLVHKYSEYDTVLGVYFYYEYCTRVLE
jgi:hypothetical protein